MERDPRIKARLDRELAALAARPDRPIDLTDAPQLPAEAWQNPIRGLEAWLKVVRANRLYKPVKQAVSMRLDADVVAWLKQSGPGYQTRANQILREKMLGELSR
ncbi:MAG TPA: BrnA antitoxin family protein [Terracidiphilus sp.]|nr:BrnA antitoxin family protein [Terracidiphilus sp.]